MKVFLQKNRRFTFIAILIIVIFILMTLFGRLTELARLSNERDEIATENQNLQRTLSYLRTQNAYATSVKAVEDYARETR
jgi:cell division protein FtsI/penicillin-binding protein 2